jgi:F-type H+-transporting ATPase subunit b
MKSLRRLPLWLCLFVMPCLWLVALRPAPAGAHGARLAHAEEPGRPEAEAKAGGEEEGPVIENWWSWDYRNPDSPHHHPPFGFALINFTIYLFVLYRLAGGSFREFMHGRHALVQKALDDAAQVQKRAQAELDRYQQRIAKIDFEVGEMLSVVRRDAEVERQRIIAAAEAQAEQLKKDAQVQVQFEIERARQNLQKATARAAIDAAEAILRSQVKDADQKRLVDDYVSRLENLSQSSAPRAEAPASGRPASGGWES